MDRERFKWKRMGFKNNKVWLATTPDGTPVLKDGKVLIKYQLDQNYEYWVGKKNVKPIEALQSQTPHGKKKEVRRKPAAEDKDLKAKGPGGEPSCADAICIFTDGASSGNPGPAGIGVLLRYGKYEKEISEYIGFATNNLAELKAIEKALLTLKDTQIPVRLFTDSNYAYGVLTLNWKARKNRELVESMKKTITKFKDFKIIKVKGHSGHRENERADFLATSAIKKAQN